MEYIGLIVSVSLALAGYFITYRNNLRLTRRADRLKFVTTQIDELYGPLYVITQGGNILFAALREKARHEQRPFMNSDAPTSGEDISDWRIWIEEVFMPLNKQLEDVIINKAHLIIEEEMPPCLTEFLAHAGGYKAVIKKWELGDFTEDRPLREYPREINVYAECSYRDLKRQQMELIGLAHSEKF